MPSRPRLRGRLVRPGYRPNWLFCALAFAVAGGSVLSWGLVAARRSPSIGSYTSTATIHQKTGLPDPTSAGPPSATALEELAEKAEQQITAEANFRRAVRDLGALAGLPAGENPEAAGQHTLEAMRRGLHAAAMPGPESDELRITLRSTSSDPSRAAILANTLAEYYAEDYRQAWREGARKQYLAAQEAAARAQRESLAAEARRDAFFEQYLKPREPAARQPAEPLPVVESPPALPTPAEPPMVDNPEWVKLNEELVQLRRHEAKLLVDRTPAHPAVQFVGQQIAALEQRLGSVPRRIAGQPVARADRPTDPASVGRLPVQSPANVPPVAVLPTAETLQGFEQLKRSAEQLGQACELAARAERRVWQRCQQEPPIRIELARPCGVPAPEGPGVGLILAALAVGLVSAAGVAMIQAGLAAERPLATLAQVEAALGNVPIVGVIPALGRK